MHRSATNVVAYLARNTMLALMVLAVVAAWCEAANPRDSRGPLQVPSPDWRDQVIYFAMIDRFDDGDWRNNDQGQGEFDPRSNAHYSGGDLAGLTRRLDYLRELGASALWITPPVAHRWWDARADYGGYHGYWGEHFKRVDPHFGRLRDYRELSRQLHGRGMFLIQDIVVNHMGNWFHYDAQWQAADPTRGYARNPDADGRVAPSQAPFDRNDPRDPAQRRDAIYHWTPVIRDHGERAQELAFQLADLDDLNTESARARRALRDSYGHWIRKVGVDAFRVDTAFYVPPEFFDDFLTADDARAPGVLRVARKQGREDFLVFGEGFGIDRAFEDGQARRIDAYMRAPAGRTALPSMLNFPLHGALLDVFARGRAPAVLAHRVASMLRVHADPWRMPSFVDNHDVDRFLASGDEIGLRQALLAILTLPGIPTIYQGTEQGMREQRAAMFAAGYGSGGRDRFDRASPLFEFLKRAIALRRGDLLWSRGRPEVLAAARSGPGEIVWRTTHAGEVGIVALNTSAHAVLVDALATGAAAHAKLQPQFDLDGSAFAASVVDAEGRVDLLLPPRSARVWRVGGAGARVESTDAPVIDAIAERVWREDVAISGRAVAGSEIEIVVDGELGRAQRVAVDAAGRWQATIATSAMVDPEIVHKVVAWSAQQGASPRREFRAARDWVLRAEIDDPTGDDHGRDGRYRYPDEPGYARLRPQDLRRVRVFSAGGALRVEVEMAALSTQWHPANGFDHVAFTLFLQRPGRSDGARVMPLQQAELPGGMRWHDRLRAHGWSNAWFASVGADQAGEGRVQMPGASISVLPERRLVRFDWPAAAFADVDDWRGGRLYLNTWDYDNGYRAIAAEPQGMVYGGGNADSPRVMDETAVIELR
jgi:glycosidase